MHYIVSPNKYGIQFGDYLEALESYRDQLPSEVAAFASDEDRFTLNHPSSLHDAWVEQIAISESRSIDQLPSEIRIVVTLLGQMHDRWIVLTYEGVSAYSITGGRNPGSTPYTLHGDIWTHEVRLSALLEVVHEIAVGDGGRIEVTCRTFHVEDTATRFGEQAPP
jgi:hypothetical protein